VSNLLHQLQVEWLSGSWSEFKKHILPTVSV
jgi:hypothetical protein